MYPLNKGYFSEKYQEAKMPRRQRIIKKQDTRTKKIQDTNPQKAPGFNFQSLLRDIGLDDSGLLHFW